MMIMEISREVHPDHVVCSVGRTAIVHATANMPRAVLAKKHD
jgi:hypothetical protein